ncbi:hypothetical protein [Paenimyroides ceti]
MEYVTGYIDKFSYCTTNGKNKVELHIRLPETKALVFIQFQGRKIDKLQNFTINQLVSVAYEFNGKVSSMGKNYNNLIGHDLKLLSYEIGY